MKQCTFKCTNVQFSFLHVFVTDLWREPETCIRAISDKWDLNACSLKVLKYLWVSFLHPGVGGQTLDGVSFRAAECTLDHGEAVGMDHPAVPSQIWLTKKRTGFYKGCKKMCVIGTCQLTQSGLHACHEDLWSCGATLQAGPVAIIRWRAEAGDFWNWKGHSQETVKQLGQEKKQRLGWGLAKCKI